MLHPPVNSHSQTSHNGVAAASDESSLLVVCGETSSDEHTAPVIAWLKKQRPSCHVFGMGGKYLAEEGMDLTVDARETASVMGLTEVVGKLSSLFKAYKTLVAEVRSRNTKIALLVDFPDFNLRLARELKSQGVTVYYFISPQLWAWRQGRIRNIKETVDKMFPIFPFEEDFYRSHGVEATFVGHPFLDRPDTLLSTQELIQKFQIPEGKRLVALLPGSRRAEISKIFPTLLEVARRYESDPDIHFLVPMAFSVEEQFADYHPLPKNLTCIPGHAREVLNASDAGIIASGTATVEAALSGVPFCLAYKVSFLTYFFGKLLIRGVRYVGMPNLILGKYLVHEYLQENCNPDILQNELDSLLFDTDRRKELLAGLAEVKRRLAKTSNLSVAEEVGSELVRALEKIAEGGS